jgi:hypothetical protein
LDPLGYKCALCGGSPGLRTEPCHITEDTKAKLLAHAEELKEFGVALEECETLGESVDAIGVIALVLAVADSLDSGVLHKLVLYLRNLEIPEDEILRLRLDEPENVLAHYRRGARTRSGGNDRNLTAEPSMPGIELVYSYSHKDREFRNQLAAHLSPLVREGLISTWYDRDITPGNELDREIDARLDRAQIILLLVSADFIASEYCYSREMKKAMERHEAGDARVIPVIVRPVDWLGTPFRKLLGLPDDGRAVTLWSNRDEAYLNIIRGVRRAAGELLSPEGYRSCPIVLKICEIFYSTDFDGVVVGGELQNPTGMSYQVTDWSLSIPALNASLKPYFSAFGTGRYRGPSWWRMPLDLPGRKIATGALFFSFSEDPSWRERISREEPLHARIRAHIFPAGLSEQPVEIYKLNTLRSRNQPPSAVAGLSEREAKILSCAAQGDGSILVRGNDQTADRSCVQAGPCFLPYESGSFPKADFEPWIEALDALVTRGLIKLESKGHYRETYVLTPLGREAAKSP